MADEGVLFQSGILATVPDGSTVAADIINATIYQRVKLTWGANGTAVDASAANPIPVTLSTSGADEIATAQVSVANTSTAIVAARSGRQDVTITNHGTTDVYIGATGVTTATGMLLVGIKGGAITISGGAAVFGIVGSGTQTVSYLETF